jgi:ferric-dicitrate binding protein FerR (iron transport regulator)
VKNSFTDYREFSVEQFMEDSFFQEWVLMPDIDSDQFWFNWLSQNPDKSEVLSEAKNLLQELRIPEYSLSNKEIEGGMENIRKKFRTEKRLTLFPEKKRSFWKQLLVGGISAGVVLGIFWNLDWEDKVELKTAFGETLPFTLPDGSKVVLNANSKLTFSENWEKEDLREIWLEGEAFFDVVHLESHQPFLVYTSNGVEVEVLGTSFSVYDRNKKSQIVLEEGNVSLSLANSDQPREKILMEPGDLVAIEDDKVEKRKVKAENYASWTENLLILDQTSLAEIIRIAKENFGLEIEVDSNVSLSQTASGSMLLEDSDQFMELTSKIFNISIERKESKYVFTPNY